MGFSRRQTALREWRPLSERARQVHEPLGQVGGQPKRRQPCHRHNRRQAPWPMAGSGTQGDPPTPVRVAGTRISNEFHQWAYESAATNHITPSTFTNQNLRATVKSPFRTGEKSIRK